MFEHRQEKCLYTVRLLPLATLYDCDTGAEPPALRWQGYIHALEKAVQIHFGMRWCILPKGRFPDRGLNPLYPQYVAQ